jgi:hypothetical protein
VKEGTKIINLASGRERSKEMRRNEKSCAQHWQDLERMVDLNSYWNTFTTVEIPRT